MPRRPAPDPRPPAASPGADAGAVDRRSAPASADAPSASGAGPSALAAALDRVGDRWSLLLVEALLHESRRFNELSEAVPGIAPNILSDRLRRLERGGIVVATPYSRRPVRMEYALSSDGRELAGALRLLAAWGARRGGEGEPLRHDLCGSPLEAEWRCPTCDVTVGDGDDAREELTRL